jgi:putative restriction endonuclease
MRPRLGQGAFRILVTDAHGRRCAVTREKALPVLQAAHTRPLSEGGVHSLDNGLLLRADVHALYDRGYVTVTPDLTFRASRRLKDDFDNGEHYFAMSGSRVWVPEDEASRPTPMWESRSFFSAIGWASTS